MMMKIKCPECGIEGSMSLLESSYEGPYKCWKCRALFTIRLKNNELESCEPLSQEDFEKQQEIAAMKNRLKRS
jgi:DNA-directed RNA polymerase subunit RPC12/RpoP